MTKDVNAVFIGASAGGVSALERILRGLGKDFELPIVVVQHLPADSKLEPALIFGHSTHMKVQEAFDKCSIENGNVYFAPPAYHLLVEKDHCISLSQDEPVYYSRPSIDVMFESAALAYGPNACGILLTGANQDGARGLKTIHDLGGQTMVQDPKDAEATAMPLAALELFQPDLVGSIQTISQRMTQLQGESHVG